MEAEVNLARGLVVVKSAHGQEREREHERDGGEIRTNVYLFIYDRHVFHYIHSFFSFSYITQLHACFTQFVSYMETDMPIVSCIHILKAYHELFFFFYTYFNLYLFVMTFSLSYMFFHENF
jgi:hypothetical protein